MDTRFHKTLIGATVVTLILGAACSKGSGLGGVEGAPAAVETAGVPRYEEHGAEQAHNGDEHGNIATPHEREAAGLPEPHSTQGVGASSAGDLEPDAGNVTTVPSTNPH